MGTARKDKDGDWVVYDSLKIDRYDLEGSISSIKDYLDGVRERALGMGMKGEGSLDLMITDGYVLEVVYYFYRFENKKERESREAAEAKIKADARAKRKAAAERKKLKTDPEYAEYERLKAKFGA